MSQVEPHHCVHCTVNPKERITIEKKEEEEEEEELVIARPLSHQLETMLVDAFPWLLTLHSAASIYLNSDDDDDDDAECCCC